jgi:ATP-dependent DNA helicase RecG
MRENLEYFFKSLMQVKGVGEKFFQGLNRLLPNTRFKDILFHLPVSVIDRTSVLSVMEAPLNQISTLKVEVLKHISPPFVRGK